MDEQNYWIDRELAEELRRQEEGLLRGDSSDYADYRYRVGVIYGIHFAMQVLTDARDRAIREEESESRI